MTIASIASVVGEYKICPYILDRVAAIVMPTAGKHLDASQCESLSRTNWHPR
jgi:hypothetical protein